MIRESLQKRLAVGIRHYETEGHSMLLLCCVCAGTGLPHSQWPTLMCCALHTPPVLQKLLEDGEGIRLVAGCSHSRCRDGNRSAMV